MCVRTGKLTIAILALLMSSGAMSAKMSRFPPPLQNLNKSNIYIGLSYSPTWSKIDNFAITANDGSTAAVYPMLDGGSLLSSSFDFQVQDPKIRFGNNTIWGMEGSVGYKGKTIRMELEIGYGKFETIGANGSYEGDNTTYLLAKELAHNVVSGNTEKLGQALAVTSPQDIVAFAQDVGRTSSTIDSKVCNKKVAIDETPPPGVVMGVPTHSQADPIVRWSCIDYGSSGVKMPGEVINVGSFSARFETVSGHDKLLEDSPGNCNRVCSGSPRIVRCSSSCHSRFGSSIYTSGASRRWYSGRNTNRGWPGTAIGKINTAQGMAGDLVSLDDAERYTVAGILTRTVTGGEVVEVRAVATTSIITNVCYDLEQKVLAPFGCVGLGTNIVSVADGHINAKLAYKLKAGLSYYVTPKVVAFVSGYYHRVWGSDEYKDVPVQHLLDDRSPEGRSKNYALAKFKMAYTGAEFGIRLVF